MTTPAPGTPLLACPFCGETPSSFPSGDGTGQMIDCTTPGCVNPHVSYYPTEAALDAWNARAPDPKAQRLADALETILNECTLGREGSEIWADTIDQCAAVLADWRNGQ